MERILALAYVPLLAAGISACGSDPAGAAGPRDGTQTGPIASATRGQDLRVRPLTAVCGNGIVDAGGRASDHLAVEKIKTGSVFEVVYLYR